MSLKPVNYISLSALSYIDFNSSMKNKTIEHLVNNKLIKEDDLSSPELSTPPKLFQSSPLLETHQLSSQQPKWTICRCFSEPRSERESM